MEQPIMSPFPPMRQLNCLSRADECSRAELGHQVCCYFVPISPLQLPEDVSNRRPPLTHHAKQYPRDPPTGPEPCDATQFLKPFALRSRDCSFRTLVGLQPSSRRPTHPLLTVQEKPSAPLSPLREENMVENPEAAIASQAFKSRSVPRSQIPGNSI